MMSNSFDAAGEAHKIAGLAKEAMHDQYKGHLFQAEGEQLALANELASIWGDPAKMTAVAKPLEDESTSGGMFGTAFRAQVVPEVVNGKETVGQIYFMARDMWMGESSQIKAQSNVPAGQVCLDMHDGGSGNPELKVCSPQSR